jgi:hypothetical protein
VTQEFTLCFTGCPSWCADGQEKLERQRKKAKAAARTKLSFAQEDEEQEEDDDKVSA